MPTSIFSLSNLATLAAGDVLPVTDVSDTTQAAEGSTKKTTFATLAAAVIASNSNIAEYAAVNPTAAGLALLDDANAGAQLTTLGLSANGASLVTAADYAAMKALLDLEIGTDVQAFQAVQDEATWEAGVGTTESVVSPAKIAAAIAALASGSGDVATDAIWDAAGDLAVGSGASTAARLAIGGEGTFLGVVGGVLAYATPSGSGDVVKVGTPANNQMPVWTGDGTIEGTADFTYDGTSLNLATGKNFQIAGGTVLADAAGTLTLSGIDAIDATTEATIEAAIDTLANLVSIQGRTVTLADAGADAIFGWDDSAGAYQNLSASDARTALGLTALATTTPGTNVATFLATPTSSNLRAALTDEDGDGALLFAYAPVTLSTGTALVRADHGNRLLICSVAGTHTVEDDTTGVWAAGDTLYGVNTSAGNVVLDDDGTTTVTAGDGKTLTVPAGGSWALVRTGANAWLGGAVDASGGGSVATDAIFDAAGDLVQGTGANTSARLALGTALQVLQVNSGATAAEWVAVTGTGSVVRATSPTLVTPALGTPASGNLSSCTADGTSPVGFRNIPQNSQSTAYTTVLADAGKHILHPTADNNARTFTIDSNANVAYPIGTRITFVNQINTVTIAITSDTMTLAGAGTTGSRTLAANGIATALKVGTTSWVIAGTGLT